MCGEKAVRTVLVLDRMGSPPRVRGKEAAHDLDKARRGITPACAGKRSAPGAASASARDHPRVCGEEGGRSGHFLRFLGSPPRVRGKATINELRQAFAGITPACAGKSRF